MPALRKKYRGRWNEDILSRRLFDFAGNDGGTRAKALRLLRSFDDVALRSTFAHSPGVKRLLLLFGMVNLSVGSDLFHRRDVRR